MKREIASQVSANPGSIVHSGIDLVLVSNGQSVQRPREGIVLRSVDGLRAGGEPQAGFGKMGTASGGIVLRPGRKVSARQAGGWLVLGCH